MRKPDVIYIGLQKTGSAFLRSYFTQHPEVSWTRHATMFQLDPFVTSAYLDRFASQAHAPCIVDMYEGVGVGYRLGRAQAWSAKDALAPGAPLDGEVLIADPQEIAARIKNALPQANIILTFRNQVAWLKSNYLHYMLQLPQRRRSFADFLQTREGRLLLAAGDYSKIVDLYRNVFGPDRVCILLLEDIGSDEAGSLRALCSFLRVSYVPFSQISREYNTGIGAGRGALVRAYSKLGISDDVARRSRALLKPLEWLAMRRTSARAMSKGEEAMLRAFYAAGNYQLSRQLGRELSMLGYTC